jgi:transposase
VRLIAPHFVTADVKSAKHEGRDAEAIGEAVPRPPMRFVPIKRREPQALQALPRLRERLMKARTALVNEIRGLLSAYGLVLPHSIAQGRALLGAQLADHQANRTALSTAVVWHLYEEFLALEKRLESDAEQLAARGQAHPACQRRQTISGSGPGTATALIAALGDVTQVKNGRQLAAWLGVVPRAHAPGGQRRLLGISTRGARSRRNLRVHGARATLRWVDTQCEDRRQWRRALIARRGKHRAAVALAHKHARMVWALLAHNQAYGVRTGMSTG